MFGNRQLKNGFHTFLGLSGPEKEAFVRQHLDTSNAYKILLKILAKPESSEFAAALAMFERTMNHRLVLPFLRLIDQSTPLHRTTLIQAVKRADLFQIDRYTIEFLRSIHPEIRESAVKLILARARPTTYPLFRQILLERRQEFCQPESARLAYELGQESSVELLSILLRAKEEAVRLAAIQFLGELRGEIVSQLLMETARQDEIANCRAHAILELGRKQQLRALPTLFEALTDPEPTVRLRTIQALSHYKHSSLLAPLLHQLETGAPDIKNAVIRAFGRIGSPEAIYALFRFLCHADPELVRLVQNALRELFEQAGEEIATTLLQLALREPQQESLLVFAFLERLGHQAIITTIIRQIELSSAMVQRTFKALFALLQSPLILKVLLDLFITGSEETQRFALDMLEEIRDSQIIPPLLSTFSQASWWIQASIIPILGKLAKPEVLPLLRESLHNPELVWLSLEALASFKDHDSARLIIEILPILPDHIKIIAFTTLQTLGNATLLAELEPYLHHPNPTLAAKARETVSRLAPQESQRCTLPLMVQDMERLLHLESQPDDFRREALKLRERFALAPSQALLAMFESSVAEKSHQAIKYLNLCRDQELVIAFFQGIRPKPMVEIERFIAALRFNNPDFILEVLCHAGLGHNDRELLQFCLEVARHVPVAPMIPGLLKLLEDDWWLASTAASALTRLKAAEALPLLLRLLYQYDRRWVALTHLPAFRDPRIEPEIVKCLSDPRRHIRVATLKSLGQIGARASVAVIQHYLEDPEEMVRIETENTLRILLQSDMSLSKSEQHHLIQEACGPDKTRRARAIEQLRQMATRQHLDLVGPLMSLIQQDDITIRTRAIKFLEDWHESATIFQFLDTLRDLNRDLIDKAIDAISQTRGQLMQATINDIIWQKLENLAQPPSPYLHRFAVEIATNIKLKSALPPLRQLTNSSDWDIREIAIAAVGKIGGKEAITTLAELLDRPETRWPAIHALGVYGKSEALPLLLPWLENSDIRIQLSTLEAIGKIQDRQAIPAIRQMQRQAHPLVKQTAKQILEILENL